MTKATQMNEMDKVDVLVATPLRLKSLIEKKRVSLSAVKYLVLDEADKLFEMGFVEQVDAAAAACDGPNVTRALFSATLPETVERLARSVMSAPMRLTIGERNAASETVKQSLVFCGQERGNGNPALHPSFLPSQQGEPKTHGVCNMNFFTAS